MYGTVKSRIKSTPGKTSFKGRQSYWANGTAQTPNVTNFSGRVSTKREVPSKEKPSTSQSKLGLNQLKMCHMGRTSSY